MSWLKPALVVLGLAALVVAPIGQGGYITYVLTSWLVFSVAAMGLNLTLGYAGQVSLAQASFMGIGAYTTALMTLGGIHWVLAAPCAMALTFVIGLLLGYPALRVQHHFLAFVTLAFNTLVFLVLRNEEWLTGGSFGLVGMPRPDFWVVERDEAAGVLLLHAGRLRRGGAGVLVDRPFALGPRIPRAAREPGPGQFAGR